MKVVVYLRTSTTEQFPEIQEWECLEFVKARGFELYDTPFVEQISGFKQVERPKYDEVKELARTGKVGAVVVWALDRWVRNRDTLLQDVSVLRTYGCKLYSVKEAWLEAINIEGPLGRTITDFLLGMVGTAGELESQRKSERVRLAIRKKDGVTVSHKGNKWGRKSLGEKVDEQIRQLRLEGATFKEITEQVHYWKDGHKKFVSKGYVHKTLSKIGSAQTPQTIEVING